MGKRDNKKKPRTKNAPRKSAKVPRRREDASATHLKPVWKVATFDSQGPKDLEPIDADHALATLIPKLGDYEKLTWGQIEQNRKLNHSVAVGKLTGAAQRRLAELNQDDVDELFRFRFGSTGRLWGIRDQATFKVLWWDPHHKVCPSTKD